MLRKIFAIIILLSICYFLGGWIAVQYGVLEKEVYFSFAGIVGALASITGLLSFLNPPLTKSDLKELELEQLKSLTKTSEELVDLENARTNTRAEIDELKFKKQEMEVLVKKASMSLFLQEEHDKHEKGIIDHVKSNETLKNNIDKIVEIKEKLSALDEEIESSPHVELLISIISSAREKRLGYDDFIKDMPPFTKMFFMVFREINKAINDIVKIIWK